MPLLLNGGGETGDLTGWAVSDMTVVQSVPQQLQQHATVTPFEGNSFFTLAGASSNHAFMQQTGTSGLADGAIRLIGRVHTEFFTDEGPQDRGEVILELLDGGSNVLASISTGQLTTPNEDWTEFALELAVPAESVEWVVRAEGTLEVGSFVNVFYDDFQFVAAPELLFSDGFEAP